eukprot:CAMPEP_0185837670 /NCGR_PEP_ID=MMETSP1353-20130828/11812_1 /TAXON_ID=1077150 /ORGANISM="Erythrolobus australicus, Strain CCMP3124" /LENGTH=53 /DNA_ID=CAMNT_0028536617 /DNA_START=126 /DNA_END=284 /DNA_ORIENTATION=-
MSELERNTETMDEKAARTVALEVDILARAPLSVASFVRDVLAKRVLLRGPLSK